MPIKKQKCEVCGRFYRKSRLVPLRMIKDDVFKQIIEEHPDVSRQGNLCLRDFNNYMMKDIIEDLEEDKGDLDKIEEEVVESLEDNDFISENVNEVYQETLSFGDRVADRIAEFGGSWTFILSFLFFMASWIIVNGIVLAKHPVDPYPFILLNLFLSTLAAIQAPIILMSQNRQAEKDRVRAEEDYKTNLKAELQIQHINSKIDYMTEQWGRLFEIQNRQMELLEEARRPRHKQEI